jgi:uncharacterized membrane protein YkvA (DUF1232 family)
MLNRLKAIKERFKSELKVYRLIISDPRTPRLAKWLLGTAMAYAISPIDLIPDFIPVLGYLDDVMIVPTLVILAVKLIPQEVVDDCRRRANDSPHS